MMVPDGYVNNRYLHALTVIRYFTVAVQIHCLHLKEWLRQ